MFKVNFSKCTSPLPKGQEIQARKIQTIFRDSLETESINIEHFPY